MIDGGGLEGPCQTGQPKRFAVVLASIAAFAAAEQIEWVCGFCGVKITSSRWRERQGEVEVGGWIEKDRVRTEKSARRRR